MWFEKVLPNMHDSDLNSQISFKKIGHISRICYPYLSFTNYVPFICFFGIFLLWVWNSNFDDKSDSLDGICVGNSEVQSFIHHIISS